jgi:hypothetical protein
MRIIRLSLQFALFCMLFLFLACTSTQFSTIWKDETYQGHPEKILVINSLPNPATRRIFEDELVKALKERGKDAVMSYTFMPAPVVSDKDAIAAQAKVVGADTVLISSSIGPQMDATGDRYLNIQTDVYDIKSNKLVFSAATKTRIRPAAPYLDQIQSYVKDLVEQQSRMGLF